MDSRPRDTTVQAWSWLEDRLRTMTPAQRVAKVLDLTRTAHAFALAQIRRTYPNEDARTHRLRLLARTVDAATMRAAFDWPPDESG